MPRVKPATEQDWSTEYLDAIIAVKTVDGVDGAIAHIRKYGSQHTDCIVAEDQAAAERFLARLDSAIVLHNASTQFADGGEFGMGAEIGIATGRLHARGPVGVEQLTTFKYVVRGTGPDAAGYRSWPPMVRDRSPQLPASRKAERRSARLQKCGSGRSAESFPSGSLDQADHEQDDDRADRGVDDRADDAAEREESRTASRQRRRR